MMNAHLVNRAGGVSESAFAPRSDALDRGATIHINGELRFYSSALGVFQSKGQGTIL